MTSRSLFGLLVLGQLAHSAEEYLGRLWETFPPAAMLTGLVSSDRAVGFLVINVALNAIGVAAWGWAVVRQRRVVGAISWGFVAIEILNGIGHPLWSVAQGGYTPGLGTAPILLVLAVMLAWTLRSEVSGGRPAA